MKTPNLEAAFQQEAEEAVRAGLEKLEENWMNREVKLCKNCSGSRWDSEDMSPCIACDGTGADIIVEYGVEDGKFVSRVTQTGIEALKEVCKIRRELEVDKGMMKRAAETMMIPFQLPLSAQLELEYLYPEFKDWCEAGEYRKCAKYVRRHYPEFMCTPLLNL